MKIIKEVRRVHEERTMIQCDYCGDKYPKMVLHYCDELINKAFEKGWSCVHVNKHGVLVGKPPPTKGEFYPLTNETLVAGTLVLH